VERSFAFGTRRPFALATLVAAALASGPLACSKSESDGGSSEGAAESGCIQGVLVDGLTGKRVAIPSDGGKGLHVLAQDRLLPGTAVVSDPADTTGANPWLVGEYYLCGVPVDEEFPLFAWLDGYQPFEGQIRVNSTAASRSPAATQDLQKPQPTEIVNVRIYPQNTQVKDLEVVVTHAGLPLEGATVVLRSVGTNFLDPVGQMFLSPTGVRQPTLSGTTDAQGITTFAAADLVLGGHYTYTVLPPEGGSQQTALAAAPFVLGLRAAANTAEPYRITVNLDQAIDVLVELSRSTDALDPDKTGALTIWFNREVEVVPGTEDALVATILNQTTAELVDNVADNDKPDNVKLTIAANQVTLTPKWATEPDKDPTEEIDLQIDYQGLKLRPVASPATLNAIDVTGTVRFYK
jgi:hypothetical protein